MRADKGKAAGNLDLDRAMHRLKRTHLFGDAFAFPVDACGIERVRAAEILLWNVREAGGLFAVDSTRTGEKKFVGRVGLGKAEHARCAVDDGGEHIERLLGGLSAAGLSGGVDDVLKVAVRKREAANISRKKGEGRISCKMGTLHRKGRGIAGKDRGASVEIELPVDVGKAFQQPTPKKASASRNKEVLILHLMPERLGLVEDMVEIGGGQRLLYHRLDLAILADVWITWLDGASDGF